MLRDLEAFLRYVTLIAARFYLLTYLLSVTVISVDFSKGFDTLLEKMASWICQ